MRLDISLHGRSFDTLISFCRIRIRMYSNLHFTFFIEYYLAFPLKCMKMYTASHFAFIWKTILHFNYLCKIRYALSCETFYTLLFFFHILRSYKVNIYVDIVEIMSSSNSSSYLSHPDAAAKILVPDMSSGIISGWNNSHWRGAAAPLFATRRRQTAKCLVDESSLGNNPLPPDWCVFRDVYE